MRTTQIVAFILTITVLLTFAEVSLADAKREEKPRFKGVELYSWKSQGNNWVFVMLDGTNRLKSTDEIKKAKNQLKGVGALKQAFSKLAKDEQVVWIHMVKGFEFPPKTIQKEIATAAKEAEIKLAIANQEK